MDPDRFARLKRIVLAASKLPVEERGAYLIEACGDDAALAREAEVLLGQPTDRLDDLVDKGVDQAVRRLDTPSARWISLRPGESLGPYRILATLGEGGMGVVYHAEQTEPIRREVALKVVRGEVRSEQVLARFEAERQTLAMMDHPSIARVLDAGSEDGTPYFVMELVRGEPITELVRRRELPLDERMRLFGSVCRGVQHAHQKGVIHRDLKPSNVLVSEQDGVATPKIIDFGIAKAIGDAPGITLTREGQLVGTLEYMSPEQVSGHSGAVDTRTDVYSLGVILYELVTGRLPYETRGRSVPELLRAIASETPPPVRVAGASSTRPNEDLEIILAKALEKDPDRRYIGAGTLADDIERSLRSEPLVARPPSTFYQMRKLVARNRVSFAFGGLVVLFLLVFGITMAFQVQAQRRERARAEAQAQKAQQVSAFLTDLLQSANPGESGGRVTVREILRGAARDLDRELADQPEALATLHLVVGDAYRSLAEYPEARNHLERALELRTDLAGEDHPDVAEAQVALATYHMNQNVDAGGMAVADSLASAALAADLAHYGPRHEAVARDLELLGLVAKERAQFARAESLLAEGLTIRRQVQGADHPDVASTLGLLAQPLYFQGRPEEAEGATRRSLEIRRERLGPDHPRVSDSMNDLAFLLQKRGAFAEAESLYLRSIDIWRRVFGERHAALGRRLSNVGSMYKTLGRLDEAEDLLTDALSIRSEAHGDSSHFVAVDSNNLGTLYDSRGDYARAELMYERAQAIWRKSLGERHPDYLTTKANRAVIISNQGRHDEAQAIHREVLTVRRQVHGEHHSQTALSHLTLGTALLQDGEHDAAERHLDVAREIWTEVLGPRHLFLAVTRGMKGGVHLGRGEFERAEEELGRAIELYSESPGAGVAFLARHRTALGRALLAQGRIAEAEQMLEEAVANFEVLAVPGSPFRADALLAVADLRLTQDRWPEAEEAATQALEVFRTVFLADNPRTALAAVFVAVCRARDKEHGADTLLAGAVSTAIEHPANDPGERTRARERAAAAFAELGRPDDAKAVRALGE